MINFKNKKILLLGGIARSCFIVEQAKKLGIYTIVADYYLDSPAKAISDEAWNISAIDIEALVSKIKENPIDGVFTSYNDMLMPYCKQLADKLHLPTYFTEEMLEMSTNKFVFKKNCIKFGIPVPESYQINDDTLKTDVEKLVYPVFVKPVDGSGSRGANVCMNKEQFLENYSLARKYSKSGKVLVEEYLTGTDIGVDYVVIEGEPYLLSMWDRIMSEGRPSAVNHADLQILPSLSYPKYKSTLDAKVKLMMKSLGFKNGIFFFQGYSKDGDIKFFEMGCRLGGTWNYIDEYYYGLNPIDMLLTFALTGSMIEHKDDIKMLDENLRGGKAAVISLLTEKERGVVSKIEGTSYLKNNSSIVKYWQLLKAGDEFCRGTQTDVAIIRLQIVSSTFAELKQLIKEIYNHIRVYGEDGSNILSPYVKLNTLNQYK